MNNAPEYCLLWIQSWATCMNKSEWASWAQAFFSVMAIGAAAWVAFAQHRKEQAALREAKRQADSEKYLLIQSQLAQIDAACDHLVRRIQNDPHIRWPELIEEVAAAQDSLRAIPRLELLDGELASRLGGVDAALRQLRAGFASAAVNRADAQRALIRDLWGECRVVLRHAAAWAVASRATTFTAADIAEREQIVARAKDAAERLEEVMRTRQVN